MSEFKKWWDGLQLGDWFETTEHMAKAAFAAGRASVEAEQLAYRKENVKRMGKALGEAFANLEERNVKAAPSQDEWKDAVIDELVICHIYNSNHDNDPRKAIKDAIEWNVQVSLDPSVSSDAQALIDRGRREAAPSQEHTMTFEELWDVIDSTVISDADVAAMIARLNGYRKHFAVNRTSVEAAPSQEPVIPTYGQIPWSKLVTAIGEANGSSWEPDESYYIGHQPAPINMNSLNRIVSKFATHPSDAAAQIAELKESLANAEKELEEYDAALLATDADLMKAEEQKNAIALAVKTDNAYHERVNQLLRLIEDVRGALAYVAVGNAKSNPNACESTCQHAICKIDLALKEQL